MPLSWFAREEAHEMKLIRRQAAGGQRGYQRAGARHWLDPKACGESGSHDPLAWIADAGRAGVRDQRHLFPALQPREDFFAAFGFVEFEMANQRFRDLEMLQQLACPARIFCCDDIAFTQSA